MNPVSRSSSSNSINTHSLDTSAPVPTIKEITGLQNSTAAIASLFSELPYSPVVIQRDSFLRFDDDLCTWIFPCIHDKQVQDVLGQLAKDKECDPYIRRAISLNVIARQRNRQYLNDNKATIREQILKLVTANPSLVFEDNLSEFFSKVAKLDALRGKDARQAVREFMTRECGPYQFIDATLSDLNDSSWDKNLNIREIKNPLQLLIAGAHFLCTLTNVANIDGIKRVIDGGMNEIKKHPSAMQVNIICFICCHLGSNAEGSFIRTKFSKMIRSIMDVENAKNAPVSQTRRTKLIKAILSFVHLADMEQRLVIFNTLLDSTKTLPPKYQAKLFGEFGKVVIRLLIPELASRTPYDGQQYNRGNMRQSINNLTSTSGALDKEQKQEVITQWQYHFNKFNNDRPLMEKGLFSYYLTKIEDPLYDFTQQSQTIIE